MEAQPSKIRPTMGYQDRDWYKDAQRGKPPVTRKPSAPQRKSLVFSYILSWIIIGAAVYGLVTTFILGTSGPRVQIQPNGPLVLGTNRAGNYVANGAINGVSVRFLVDTGASMASVSQRMARHMGLVDCVPSFSTTANGLTQDCVAVARDLRFGDFQVQNVKVAVMPRMEAQALLGMNVLGQFHIIQNDGEMIISKALP